MICDNKTAAHKSVAWKSTCNVRRYAMENSEQHRQNAWYQATDYMKFKKDCKKMCELAQEFGVKKVEEELENETCLGLEKLIVRQTSALVLKRRNVAWNVVLSEQIRERSSKRSNSSNHDTTEKQFQSSLKIAQAYSIISRESHIDAHKKAMRLKRELFKNEGKEEATATQESRTTTNRATAATTTSPLSYPPRQNAEPITVHNADDKPQRQFLAICCHNRGVSGSNVVPSFLSIGKKTRVAAQKNWLGPIRRQMSVTASSTTAKQPSPAAKAA